MLLNDDVPTALTRAVVYYDDCELFIERTREGRKWLCSICDIITAVSRAERENAPVPNCGELC
jgi:hypothetical protein